MFLLYKACGISIVDIKNLKDARHCMVEAISYSPKKELVQIKGLSDAKVHKIIETGMQIWYLSPHFNIIFFENKKVSVVGMYSFDYCLWQPHNWFPWVSPVPANCTLNALRLYR